MSGIGKIDYGLGLAATESVVAAYYMFQRFRNKDTES